MSNYMRCGKTLSHWFLKASSEIYVKISPTLDDIKTESDKVKLFFNYLFVYNKGIHHNKKLKQIIDAYVLRLREKFLGIIGNEPYGK